MLSVFAAWWFLPTTENAPLESAVVVLLVANIAIYLLEHAVPDRTEWLTSPTDRRIDAFYVAARVFVLGPVFQVLVLLSIDPLVQAMDLPTPWPSEWPLLARIALALVVAELIAFSMHYAMHRVPALWRYHATHHAQTKLTSARWSSGHPGEFALFQLPIFLVVVLLGPDAIDIAGALMIGRTVTILAHSNLRLSSASLGWLFTSPEHHRRHHALGATEPANFGDVFILFDRLAGTFSAERTTQVGAGTGRNLSLGEQLVLPYRMQLLSDDSPETEPSELVIDLRDPAHEGTPSTSFSESSR